VNKRLETNALPNTSLINLCKVISSTEIPLSTVQSEGRSRQVEFPHAQYHQVYLPKRIFVILSVVPYWFILALFLIDAKI
jgi:hypothetical protein